MKNEVSLFDICEFDVIGDSLSGIEEGYLKSHNWYKGESVTSKFIIEYPYLTFVFSCNGWDEEHGFHMFINGKEEFSIFDSILGIPQTEYALDLRDFLGQPAYIQINDMGSCENIFFKKPVFTNKRPFNVKWLSPHSKCKMLDCTLNANGQQFLHLPIDINEHSDFLEFYIDSKPCFTMALRLAKSGKYDFIANIPIGEFNPQEIRICGNKTFITPENLRFFEENISVSKEPIGKEKFYTESGRPKLHFTAPYGGSGDMIGFYRYNGIYNIGYLHDPAYNNWNDNATWSYSSSTDLFKWDNQRMVVRKGFKTKRSSGCAFVDEKNRTGLQTGEHPPILLFYSVEGQLGQRYSYVSDLHYTEREKGYLSRVSIKYSIDGGKSFVEYENNPIFITNGLGGHDPEVVYYEPEDKFVMVVHDFHNERAGFDFYESYDLLNWKFMNTLPDYWETPNFYQLPLEDNPDEKYWILQQCDHKYTVGTFDGITYKAITEKQDVYNGAYAMRTFDLSKENRRISIATIIATYSVDCEYKGYGASTIPTEVSLKNIDGQMKLAYRPVREIEKYVIEKHKFENITSDEFNIKQMPSGLLDLEIIVSGDTTIKIGGEQIFAYDSDKGIYKVFSDCGELKKEEFSIRLIIDESITDYYLDDGVLAGSVMTTEYKINPLKCLTLSSDDRIKKIEVRYLKSPYENL